MELVPLKSKDKGRTEVVPLCKFHWGCISDCIFANGARRLKRNHEYVKGLHYSEMQTSELWERLSSWSLFSDIVWLIIDAALLSMPSLVHHIMANANDTLVLLRTLFHLFVLGCFCLLGSMVSHVFYIFSCK